MKRASGTHSGAKQISEALNLNTVPIIAPKIYLKEISAVCAEINEQRTRFKRLVNKIISIEELAPTLEPELEKLLAKLREIVSRNRHRSTRLRSHSNSARELSSSQNASRRDNSHDGMAPATSPLHREMVEFHHLFLGTGKRYRDLACRIDSAFNLAVNLGIALMNIQKRLKDLIDGNLSPLDKTGPIPGVLKVRQIQGSLLDRLILDAELGIRSFSIKRYSDGKAGFEIEGRRLTLSPVLAKLLIELSEDQGSGKGDLVDWKTMEDLMQAVLGPKRGWPPKDSTDEKMYRHAISQSIHRLRDRFLLARINPFLIQKNPQRGYRLALRRKQPTEAEDADNPSRLS